MIKKILLAGLLFVSGSSYAFNETDYTKYSASRGTKYEAVYDTAAKKHGVPKDILMRIHAIESGYWNPAIISGKKKSSHGAIGIGQFMPKTAKVLNVNPYNVKSSINGTAKYMKYLYDIFHSWELAAYSYNWGEDNVQMYIRGKKRLPKAVHRYGNIVIKEEL